MTYGKVYHRPQSIKETLALLDRPGSFILAGGTYLVPRIQEQKIEELIDIQNLPLKKMEKKGDRLFLGAMLLYKTSIKTPGFLLY